MINVDAFSEYALKPEHQITFFFLGYGWDFSKNKQWIGFCLFNYGWVLSIDINKKTND